MRDNRERQRHRQGAWHGTQYWDPVIMTWAKARCSTTELHPGTLIMDFKWKWNQTKVYYFKIIFTEYILSCFQINSFKWYNITSKDSWFFSIWMYIFDLDNPDCFYFLTFITNTAMKLVSSHIYFLSCLIFSPKLKLFSCEFFKNWDINNIQDYIHFRCKTSWFHIVDIAK